MKWVRLATAPNAPIGESWVQLLRQHGVAAYVAADSVARLVGGGAQPVPILVPEQHVERAKALLEELVGPWESTRPAE